MPSNTAIHRIEWLLKACSEPLAVTKIGSMIEEKKVNFPYPEGWGEGLSSHTETSDGMLLISNSHRFNRALCPSEISVARFSVGFDEPVFGLHRVLKGSLYLSERRLAPERIHKAAGLDMFGHLDSYEIEQTFDTSADLETRVLIIPIRQMNVLMGEDFVSHMLEILGITKLNSYNPFFEVPLSISGILDDSLDNRLTDRFKSLRLHAGILDYLCTLGIYLDSNIVTRFNKRSRSRARSVHDYLISLEGKTPTLAEIGKQFDATPNQLNKEFTAEYGESIFSFLTNFRLDQARYALQIGNEPIKVLAHAIGYAHVNHFTAAFKRKFGQPPGVFRSLSSPQC